MAELDDRLTDLVSTLLRSRMAPLATLALERLDEAEYSRTDADGSDRDPFAPTAEESPDRRAARQLGLIDSVVAARVKLELTLLERSLSLARELSAGLGSDGPEAFATVMVVDDVDRETADGVRLVGTNLLTGARRERLEAFLAAWRGAVGRLREDIGEGGY